MQTRIQKWGNSLGLRIPKSLAEEAGVKAGSEVNLSMKDGSLVVKTAIRRKYRLADLLRRVTTKNLPDAVNTGVPVGREIW